MTLWFFIRSSILRWTVRSYQNLCTFGRSLFYPINLLLSSFKFRMISKQTLQILITDGGLNSPLAFHHNTSAALQYKLRPWVANAPRPNERIGRQFSRRAQIELNRSLLISLQIFISVISVPSPYGCKQLKVTRSCVSC